MTASSVLVGTGDVGTGDGLSFHFHASIELPLTRPLFDGPVDVAPAVRGDDGVELVTEPGALIAARRKKVDHLTQVVAEVVYLGTHDDVHARYRSRRTDLTIERIDQLLQLAKVCRWIATRWCGSVVVVAIRFHG